MSLLKKLTAFILIIAAVLTGAAFAVVLTPPQVDNTAFIDLPAPDLKNGQQMFWAGGCAGCHAAPASTGDQRLVLSGGLAIKSDFGTFHVPNISPDPQAGIGDWSVPEFANAVRKGIGPDGENLYPSLPYTSYVRMTNQDVKDLFGYIMTLPESSQPDKPHDLAFPFRFRPALAFWKALYFSDKPRVEIAGASAQIERGQYLVEGPGHCGECHTPRTRLGGPEYDRWLAGGPNPYGPGMVPNITPGSTVIGSWSASEIADYLETGFTPEYDVVGGSMVEVQKNLAHLPRSDLEAIAAYLKAVPARQN